MLGAIDYITPEQAMGSLDVDAHADVFAFGCCTTLFRLRKRPSMRWPVAVAECAATECGPRNDRDEPVKPRPPQAARGLKPKGARGDQVSRDDLPRRVWKFAADSTRARGEMEDKAAHYDAESNVVSINGDFRTFVAWIDYFAKQYPSIAGVREAVKAQVMIWWEQMLLEAVLAFQDFRRSPHWIDMHTLTDEALTMAVLPRYHLFVAFKRGIYNKLGKPEVEASDPLAVPSLAAVPTDHGGADACDQLGQG